MKSAPHILFLNEFFHPDICASAVVAADHLPKIATRRPDWNFTILTGNRAWDDPAKRYPATDAYYGVNIIRVPRPAVSRKSLLWRGLGFAAFERAALRAAARLGRIDLMVGTTAPPQGGRIAAKIAARAKCPYIYKVLDLYPDTAATLGKVRRGSLIYKRWLAVDTKVMKGAAAAVSISTPITQRIARTRRIDPALLHTIHDGYDPARLTLSGPNHFAAEHNPGKAFVVQYAGNMGLSHPFETILAVARLLSAEGGIQFQFIGDGPQRAGLRERLPPIARLIDYQPADRLGEVLAAADVCLISQHDAMFDQAMPYKIYAILAAGKPVFFVGSAHAEIAEWITQFKIGWIVPHGRPEQLVEAIRGVMHDSIARDSMSQAARRLFAERFDSFRAADAWVSLIARHITP